MKKQSEKEGASHRAQPRENATLDGDGRATTAPAAIDCWEVPTLDHRQRRYRPL